MPATNPQITDHRRRPLAPPEERAKAREVARLLMTLDQPIKNWLCALVLVHMAFPGISLETALAGYVFRKILSKQPDRVLQ
jgi:hypothetical protein